MECRADLKNGILLVGGDKTFEISCNVRNYGNGLRLAHEVVFTVPDGRPYMPVRFPEGVWRFTGVLWQAGAGGERRFDYGTYGPCKLLTNAFQWVPVWDLDGDGDYLKETDERVQDFGYWFHYSSSGTTLGCVRFCRDGDAVVVGRLVEGCLGRGEECVVEVFYG